MNKKTNIFEEFYSKPRTVAIRRSHNDNSITTLIDEIIASLCTTADNFSPDAVLLKWNDARDKEGSFDVRLFDKISLLEQGERHYAWKNLYTTHESNEAFPMLGIDDINILKQAAMLACETDDVLFFEVMLSMDKAKKELRDLRVTLLSVSLWEYAIMMNASKIVPLLRTRDWQSQTIDDFAMFISSRDNDRNRFLPMMESVGRLHVYNPTWRYLPNETPLIDLKEPLADLVVRKSSYMHILRVINETQDFAELRAAFNRIITSAPKSMELIEAEVANDICALKKTDIRATLFFIAEATISLTNEHYRKYVILAICAGLITHTSYPLPPNAESAAYTIAEFAATTNNADALWVLLDNYKTSGMISNEYDNRRCIAEHALLSRAGDAFRVAKQLHTCRRCAEESLRAMIARVSTTGNEENQTFAKEANQILDSFMRDSMMNDDDLQ